MLVDKLIYKCLLPGRRSWAESGVGSATIQWNPGNDESVLLFRTDSSEFREICSTSSHSDGEDKCADIMFLVRTKAELYIVFVESKSSDVGSGFEQLESIAKKAEGCFSRDVWRKAKKFAFVVSRHSSPSAKKPAEKQLATRKIVARSLSAKSQTDIRKEVMS